MPSDKEASSKVAKAADEKAPQPEKSAYAEKKAEARKEREEALVQESADKKTTNPSEKKAPKKAPLEDELFKLEDKVKKEAAEYPVSDGSDAPKHALAQIAHAIGAYRDALRTQKSLER